MNSRRGLKKTVLTRKPNSLHIIQAVILDGCERLGVDIRDVAGICIGGMTQFAEEIRLAGR